MAAGALLALFGQWLLASTLLNRRPSVLWLLVLGLLVFAASVALLNDERRGPKAAKAIEALARRAGLRSWQVAAALTAVVLSIVTALAAGGGQKMVNLPLAVSSWILAIVLIVLGTVSLVVSPIRSATPNRPLRKSVRANTGSNSPVTVADRIRNWFGLGGEARLPRGQASKRSVPTSPAWELPAIILLGLIAFALRGWNTTHIPAFLTGDEGSAGIQAVRALDGTVNNIFTVGWYGFPQFYFFLQSISVGLLGMTTPAIRLPSALVGALTVVGTFYLAKSLYGRRAGWVAAIFLTGFHLHLHFSRIALNNVWDGLWYVLTLLALWIGWKDNRRNGYIVAGLTLGLSQYFYASARPLVLLVAGWVAFAAIMDHDRFKKAVPHLLLMLLCALVIALPSLIDFGRHPDEYMAPFRRISVLGPWLSHEAAASGQTALQVLSKQFLLGFGVFTFMPLRAWYQPDTPLLRAIPAGVFLLGVLVLAIRWRDSRSQLLLLWLLGFVVITSLSDSTPAAQRMVAVAPACAVVIAVAVEQIVAPLAARWPRQAVLLSMVAVSASTAMALADINFYFNVYTPRFVEQRAHSNDAIAQGLADALRDKDSAYQVAFLGKGMGFRSIPSIQYLAPQVKGVDVNGTWGDPQNPTIESDRIIFVFVPGREQEIAAVEESLPGGALTSVPATDGAPLFWMYKIH